MSSVYWTSRISIQIISAILINTVAITHSYKSYKNFKLSAEKHSSDTEKAIKCTKIWTLFSVLLYTLNMNIVAFKYWTFIIPACFVIEELAILTYVAAKVIMYIVFLLRMNTVFGTFYNKTFLKIFGLIIIFVHVTIHIWNFMYFEQDPYIYKSIPFAANCNTSSPTGPLLIFTAFDIIIAIWFIIAFNWSLKKLMSNYHNKIKKKKEGQLMQIAYKTTVCNCAAGISSLLMVIAIILSRD
eukprot:416456_1